MATQLVLAAYFLLITSLPLLRYPTWIPDYYFPLAVIVSSIMAAIITNLLLDQKWADDIWDNYISVLTSSVIVLFITLLLILFIVGTDPLRQAKAFQIPLNHTDILLLVIFLSLGILLSNMYILYPSFKSIANGISGFYKSVLLPPYNSIDIKIDGVERPPIKDWSNAQQALGRSILSAVGVLALSQIAFSLDQSEELIEGHLHLLWYLQDLFTADPEKMIDGSIGVIKEIINILNLILFTLYLSILLFSFSYALNSIFLIRVIQEQIRIYIDLSPFQMAIGMIIFCIPLLIVSSLIADYLINVARVIATFAIAEN